MLKLKLQYFAQLMWTTYSEKPLLLGKIEGRKRRGWQRMTWLDGITDSMDMSLCRLWELVMEKEAWPHSMGVTKSQTQLSDGTELKQALHSVPLALVLFSLMGWNFRSPQHSHLPGLLFLTSQNINFMFSPFLVSHPCFSGEHSQVIS